MANLDFDKLGLQLTKHRPELYSLDLEAFQAAIDWLRVELASRDYLVDRAELDPNTERWLLFARDEFVVAVEHTLVERVMTALIEVEKQKLQGCE